MEEIIDFIKKLNLVFKTSGILINNWIKGHNEEINYIINQLPELIDKIKERSKLIDDFHNNLENDLKENRLDFTLDILSYPDFIELISKNPDNSLELIHQYTITDKFLENILDLYNKLNINQKRLKIIKEAIILHQKEYYAGAITLLYSQIEGIITDILIEKKLIVVNNEKFLKYLNEKPIKNKNNQSLEIIGMKDKIIHGKNIIEIKDFLENLDAYQLVLDNKKFDIVTFRNKVMHGNNVDFANKLQSTQLIMWLFGLLVRLEIIKIFT